MSNLPTGSIEFDGVSKRYRLGALGTLRSTVAALAQRRRGGDRPRDFWALKDVSFRVKPGESLGLIGPNGAGKTTILKLLSTITRPTSGRIRVCGRISSLIELGAGFHPELSGRDNIFLNGAILGLKRQEIKHKLDEIIAFSELERFIDTPVKRYSSGMYVRLGFAVAAHVEPDILLVDEVLAVGDARFRSRCIQRICELQGNGTTIVLVSHNMHQIREVCTSAVLLVNGQVAEEGTPSSVIARHEELMFANVSEPASLSESSHRRSTSPGDLVHVSAQVLPSSPSEQRLTSQTSAKVSIAYRARAPFRIGRVHISTYQSDHTLCCVADSAAAKPKFGLAELSDTGVIEVTYEPLHLALGQYYVIVRITDVSDAEVIASCQSPMFSVSAETLGDHSGVFVPNVSWEMHTQSTRKPDDTATISPGGQHG